MTTDSLDIPIRDPGAAADLPVVLLSHRGPVSFAREEHGRTAKRGGGGLVTALSGLADHLDDVVWVYAATSEEDREVVEEHEGREIRLALAPEPHLVEPGDGGPDVHAFGLRPVVVEPTAHEQFYGVIANPLLWFVQHGLYGLATAPDLTREDREAYEHGYAEVNRCFAEAVVEEVERRGGRALVMLHDYHFYLVGAAVREACPDVLMSHFVHIPWPGPEGWRVLPSYERESLLRGLLGNDVVGFHTRRFARNFLLCCQEILDLPVDLRRMTVEVDGREVLVRNYPISVDVAALEELAATPEVEENRRVLRETLLADDRRMVLRVDRTDPSKNIVRGFKAFGAMLEDHPELVGRVTFLAMLQPSRQDVAEYADYVSDIGAAVAEINARYGESDHQPVDLRMAEDMPFAVAAYSLCDVLMVNAVLDGMNLVAKEAVIVNQRDGVLALSENTGAFEELGEHAVTLHPFDIQQQADALYEALTRDPERRRRDLAEAAAAVRRNDVGHWLRSQLGDLTDLEHRRDKERDGQSTTAR